METIKLENSPIVYHISRCGSEKWIMLLHAAFVDHRMFTELIAELQDKYNIIAVDISNDGPPIAPEDRLHIFDRFYKADKAHTAGQGTGLGLSISQQIMQMHNQMICLLPEDQDTGFRFTLARATQHHPRLEG